MTERSQPDRVIYWRAIREARPYWPHIGVYFLVSLLASPLALLTPLPLKIVADSVLGTEPLPGWLAAVLPSGGPASSGTILALAAGLLVAVMLLQQLQSLVSSLIKTYASEKIQLGFRAKIFRHVQRLSLAYHDSTGTADATYRLMWDATSLSTIAIGGVVPIISAGITAGSMLLVIAAIDWQLGLLALAITPVLLLGTREYRSRMRPRYREVKQIESSALAVVQEVLTSLRVVKAFAQEDREQARFMQRASAGVGARLRVALSEGAFGMLNKGSVAVGSAAVLYVGALHVQAGLITLGDLLLIIGYVGQLYGPITTMTSKVASTQSALAGAERAFVLLDQAPDVPDAVGGRAIERARGTVTFERVSFSYRQGALALEGVSFEVPAGTRIGVYGATGAGKSTLVSLLTRFYDPTAGRITLDGVDLRDYRLAELRNQYAIVLQEPVLFSTTVAENIAYAKENAGADEIVRAATLAGAHEFITQLPDGYDTLVGERGMRLSGGERQRVALARAFLKNAPILILDEPTSSVDVATERLIMEASERLMTGRTVFLIAHRISTLRACDLWIRLEHGQIRDVTSRMPDDVRAASGAPEVLTARVGANG